MYDQKNFHFFLLFLLLSCCFTSAQERFLSSDPILKKSPNHVTISFTTTKPVDVEIAVLDEAGKVIKHLAAGKLGGKYPPPAPLQKGLSQTIKWDFTNDDGIKVTSKKCSIRIRGGTNVVFGKSISDSPYLTNAIRALGTDKEGHLYILNQTFARSAHSLQVYDHEGNYIRTAFPYAANLSKKSLGDMITANQKNNKFYPKNYNDVYPRLLPYSYKGMEKISMFPNISKESGIILHTLNWVFRLDQDGSTGGRPLRFSMLFDKGMSRYTALSKDVFVANSIDGKTLYGAGPCSKSREGKIVNPHWQPGQIFKMSLEPNGTMVPFAKLPLKESWLADAQGIPLAGLAVDSKGNVYACDRANDQLAIFDPQGKLIKTIAMTKPFKVVIDPLDDSILVLKRIQQARNSYQTEVTKYSAIPNTKEIANLPLGICTTKTAEIAITSKKGSSAIWLAGFKSGNGRTGRSDVTRYIIEKGKFKITKEFHEIDKDAIGNIDVIDVNQFTEDVYINDDYSGIYRYNGITGKGGNLRKIKPGFYATEITISPKGNLFCRTGPGYSGPFERLDNDLKPVPFATGTHYLTKDIYSRFGNGHAEKGIGVGPKGKSYVMNMYGWQRYAVYGFDENGKIMEGNFLKGKLGYYAKKKTVKPNSAIIGPLPDTCGGLRVDSKGNIYIGMLYLPKNYSGYNENALDPSWRSLVGSIVKFGQEGGEWICTNKTLAKRGPKELKSEIPKGAKGIMMEKGNFMSGATNVYPEFSPFSGANGTGESPRPPIGRENCACRSPRFDIDYYDRLYVPNAVRCSVRIYDNSGNIILEFGQYGNYDSAGPKSKIPTKQIPLGWPIGVGVSAEHVYIADQLNRRILRADKTYKFNFKINIEK